MKSTQYLISNIKINNNEPFEMNLPLVFSEYGQLAQYYIRTYALSKLAVTFDVRELERFEYNTSSDESQPYNINLVDDSYDDNISTIITPLPMFGCIVSIEESWLEIAGDLTQAVYEKLLTELKIDFTIKHTH